MDGMHNAPKGPRGPKPRTHRLRVPSEHAEEIEALAKRLSKPMADAFEVWLRHRDRSKQLPDVASDQVRELLEDLGVPKSKASIVGLCAKAATAWATTPEREQQLYLAICGFLDSCKESA